MNRIDQLKKMRCGTLLFDTAKFILKTLVILSLTTLSYSCNSKPTLTSETPIANNWTEEQKRTIILISKSSANADSNPSIHNNAQEIAEKTLNECMSEYPDYYDFSYTRKKWYDIYKKISNQYVSNQ